MTAPESRILGRIRALFSKTVDRGATPEEAASAAALAQRLLFQHNLDLTDVDTDPTQTAYTRDDIDLGVGRFYVNWHRRLLSGIARTNFCRVILVSGTDRCAVIGQAHNRDVAVWLYRHVAGQIHGMAQTSMRSDCPSRTPATRAAWAREFAFGAVDTVLRRLRDTRQAQAATDSRSTALVVQTDARLKAAVADYFPTLRSVSWNSPRNGDARAAGRVAGERVSLNRPVSGMSARASLT